MRRIIALVFVVAVVCAVAAFGEDAQSRAWLLYEQGNAMVDQKEYGQALQLFKEAITAAGIFPEAEMAIGDVYQEESEYGLAMTQYEKAYNLRKAFYIPDSKYDVLYRMARLDEVQYLYKPMEDTLMKIIADDKHFVETANSRLQTQVVKNYLTRGLDRALALYTFSDIFAANAHSKLGWFYYRSGRSSQAVVHLLYAVINRVSQMNAFLKEEDVEYQFTTLEDLLAAAENNGSLSKYLDEVGFYKDLYYLAGSTFDGYPEHSVALWKLISTKDLAGSYKSLSAKQLKSPFREPLITIGR